MKTLSTKKINLFVVYLNTNVKPDVYSSAEEMKSLINDVRPTIKDEIQGFLDIQDKVSDLQRQLMLDSITQDDANSKAKELNQASQKLELTTGDDVIKIDFENEPFNQLMNFFNRTGKGWFVNGERYLDFEKDINKANQQPKTEEKK